MHFTVAFIFLLVSHAHIPHAHTYPRCHAMSCRSPRSIALVINLNPLWFSLFCPFSFLWCSRSGENTTTPNLELTFRPILTRAPRFVSFFLFSSVSYPVAGPRVKRVRSVHLGFKWLSAGKIVSLFRRLPLTRIRFCFCCSALCIFCYNSTLAHRQCPWAKLHMWLVRLSTRCCWCFWAVNLKVYMSCRIAIRSINMFVLELISIEYFKIEKFK